MKETSYVVIYDSINNYNENYKIESSIKIDLKKLTFNNNNNNTVNFKSFSDFPKTRKIWKEIRDYEHYVVALINFRNFKFNNEKNHATFDCGYSMGHLNGIGYLISIKKGKDGKWSVEKIEGTSIS